MARTSNTNRKEATAPSFIAWNVTTKGNKSYWHKVGACWQHKDKKGMTLQLEVLPMDGRIVLRHPMDNAGAAETAKKVGRS
ncbi:hypothetical protein ACFOOL_16040 [Devosia honganensis]|uniref:Uncharacterized protein n=1 Tax=Devosia honganensis TaxID=1610527 RepID=A0ABV7X420_9HYPH